MRVMRRPCCCYSNECGIASIGQTPGANTTIQHDMIDCMLSECVWLKMVLQMHKILCE